MFSKRRFGQRIHFSNFRRRNRRRSQVPTEALESRLLLSAVTVSNATDDVNGDTTSLAALLANDGGDGVSLREALTIANANGEDDTISFDLALSGQTIVLAGAALPVSGTTTFDASALSAPIAIDATGASRVIEHSAGDLRLQGLTIQGGHHSHPFGGAAFGAGIFSTSTGQLTVENSTIHNNSASGQGGGGGGIYAPTATISIVGSTIRNNTGRFGGGISAGSGGLTVVNSTINNNRAIASAARGGGIYSTGVVTVTNSTLSGNFSTTFRSSGAGIWGNDVRLFNSTVTRNSLSGSNGQGGGIFSESITANNSIIAGNSAVGDNTDLRFNSGTLTYTIIGDNQGTSLIGSENPDSNGNIIGDIETGAIDTRLGPLADNGGPTMTHALLGDSPAINAGDPGFDSTNTPTDQRGGQFARVTGGRLDIGAFETEAPGLVVTTLSDIVRHDGQTSLREAIAFARSTLAPQIITFSPDLSGATMYLSPNLNEVLIDSSLTIDGDIDNDGVADITVSANSSATTNDADSRVFVVDSPGNNATVTIDGLVIRDGHISGDNNAGGGIRIAAGDTVTLTSSRVTQNTSLDGGGAGISNAGVLKIFNSTVDQNVSGYNGGGIRAELGSTLIMVNSTAYGNRVTDGSGGGIWALPGSTVLVTNSTLSVNSASNGGGGLGFAGTTEIVLTNTTVTGNAAALGGGIFGTTSNIKLANSIILGNVATTGNQNEIAQQGTSVRQVVGSTIIGNVIEFGPLGMSLGSTTAEVASLVFQETTDYQDYNADGVHQVTVEPTFGAGPIVGRMTPGFVPVIRLNPSALNPAIDSGNDDRLNEAIAGLDYNGDGDISDTISTDTVGASRLHNVSAVANNATNTVDLGSVELRPSAVQLGNLRSGIAVTDNAFGTGYILHSATSVHTRFVSAPVFAGNSDHLVAVRFENGVWQYNSNAAWVTFTPVPTDRLIASVDFSNDTIVGLQNVGGQINGINQGYVNGDVVFQTNRFAGATNSGEFQIIGTHFDVLNDLTAPNGQVIGQLNLGIGVNDAATGTGYLMFSAESIHTRFATAGLLRHNSDHLIAVRTVAGQWSFNNNAQWINFTPVGGDRLLAAIDFESDTITSLKNSGGQIDGIDRGFLNGDLQFHANRYAGASNGGEFEVTGTHFELPPRTLIGATRAGIAATDNAKGSGFLMYSSQPVQTRFPGVLSANSDHLIAVQNRGPGQWFYDNNATWVAFTPTSGDRLLARVSFADDTVTPLQGIGGTFEGIARGYQSGDLVFAANQWGGLTNDGEFQVTGSYFEPAIDDGSVGYGLGPVGAGIAVDDFATGTGFILYSRTPVRDRVPTISSVTSSHLAAVRIVNGNWQMNDNINWLPFIPQNGDRLIAAVDFDADTMTSLQGTSGTINTIRQGFTSGDLTFTANQWNGAPNNGEFTVGGTFFEVNSAPQAGPVPQQFSAAPPAAVFTLDANGDGQTDALGNGIGFVRYLADMQDSSFRHDDSEWTQLVARDATEAMAMAPIATAPKVKTSPVEIATLDSAFADLAVSGIQ